MSQSNNRKLTATYASPTNEPFSLSQDIRAPPSSSVADKTQYLENLRQAVSTTQDQINKELTSRMEEDNARAGNTPKGIDEAKEEENYGEEVQEED